jgi:hypothetical protein
MAGNLTAQVRNIAEVAIAVAKWRYVRKITVDVRGEILHLKETLNTTGGSTSGPLHPKLPVWQGRLVVKVNSVTGICTGCSGNLERPDRLSKPDDR